MLEQKLDDVVLLRFPKLDRFGRLVHAVTTKPWNLATHCGEQHDSAARRRRQLCDALGLSFERLTTAEQVHKAEVHRVGQTAIGAGRSCRSDAIASADGLLIDQPDAPILLLSADCPLVLVFDPVRPAVGAAHASRQATLMNIAAQLVGRMAECFGSRPADMWAGVSPSAGPCCYRVGAEILAAAARNVRRHERYISSRNGVAKLDLWGLIVDQLSTAGLQRQHVELARICTICDERFFSYRREGSRTGRFGLICALRPGRGSGPLADHQQ